MKLKIAFFTLIFLTLLLGSSSSGKASPPQPQRIRQVAQLMGDGYNQLFGYTVAISGNTLAVGDPFDDQYGEEAGSVTIFQADFAGHWVAITRLTASDAEEGIRFGHSLALSGNILVVGAPYANDFGLHSGAVYIFERDHGGSNAWGQTARLTSSDAFTNDQFGWAVDVHGSTVASGAYTKSYGGRVYIYERDAGGPGAWGETAQLNPDPPGFVACFGHALDLDGDLLAVGAYGGGDYSGNAYVFQRQPNTGQWQKLSSFRAADTYAYHYFGYSIALDGWTVLVGAPGVGSLAGAAYIFTSDPAHPQDWIEQAQLTASDGAMGDYFGLNLDLSGEVAWIGAPMHMDGTGAVYIYGLDQGGAGFWGEITSVQGDDSAAGDQFGDATSIDGNMAAAGAPGKLPSGSLYIFNLNPPWLSHLPLMIR